MFENVTGILHKAGHADAPIVSLQEYIARRLGHTWSIDRLILHALDFGLPQSRPRVYLVLRKSAFFGHLPVMVPQPFTRRLRSEQLLDLSDNDQRTHTPQQQANLVNWQKKYSTYMVNPRYRGRFAFFFSKLLATRPAV